MHPSRVPHLLIIWPTTACSTSEVKLKWGSDVSRPHRQRTATRWSATPPLGRGLLAAPTICFTYACSTTRHSLHYMMKIITFHRPLLGPDKCDRQYLLGKGGPETRGLLGNGGFAARTWYSRSRVLS